MEQFNPQNEGTTCHRPHNCRQWNSIHDHCRPQYISRECGVCGQIVGFMWRSIWDRLWSLFSIEPRKGTVIVDE